MQNLSYDDSAEAADEDDPFAEGASPTPDESSASDAGAAAASGPDSYSDLAAKVLSRRGVEAMPERRRKKIMAIRAYHQQREQAQKQGATAAAASGDAEGDSGDV